MPKQPLSVTIITLNEERNIARVIQSARWADEIIVVDSGSSDRTREIAEKMGAKVLFHAWEGYGRQKNFAQSQATHDWVLNVDADEEVSPALRQEIEQALEDVASGRRVAQGFAVPRKTFYLGRWIMHGGWYPNYLVRLAHRKMAAWTEPKVHECLKVSGFVENLGSPLYHYPFFNIDDQISTNLNFARLGSEELARQGKKASVTKLLLKPLGKFLECYLWKRGFLDGLPGFVIAINAAHSMFLKYAYLIEAKLHANPRH